jgi:hypothetical protein
MYFNICTHIHACRMCRLSGRSSWAIMWHQMCLSGSSSPSYGILYPPYSHSQQVCCVYMYIIDEYVCTYIRIYLHMNVQTYMYCMHVSIPILIYEWYIYMYIHIYKYMHMYICTNICDFISTVFKGMFCWNLYLYLQHVLIPCTPLISLSSCINLQ